MLTKELINFVNITKKAEKILQYCYLDSINKRLVATDRERFLVRYFDKDEFNNFTEINKNCLLYLNYFDVLIRKFDEIKINKDFFIFYNYNAEVVSVDTNDYINYSDVKEYPIKSIDSIIEKINNKKYEYFIAFNKNMLDLNLNDNVKFYFYGKEDVIRAQFDDKFLYGFMPIKIGGE